MGQITATRNLVATKVVRLAGQRPVSLQAMKELMYINKYDSKIAQFYLPPLEKIEPEFQS